MVTRAEMIAAPVGSVTVPVTRTCSASARLERAHRRSAGKCLARRECAIWRCNVTMTPTDEICFYKIQQMRLESQAEMDWDCKICPWASGRARNSICHPGCGRRIQQL